MKTTTTLLMALGLASSAVIAQTQSSPGAGGVQTESQGARQPQYGIPPSGAQPGSAASQPGMPGSATSGASGVPSGTGTLGSQSGAQSGMPPHPGSGGSAVQSGMPPPASTDTSGAQPGMPVQPASGASGTQSGSQSGMPPSTAPGTSGAAATTGESGATGAGAAQYDMPPIPGSAEDRSQASSGASGMSSSAEGRPEPAPMARLEPKTENGITYLCAGVGADERRRLKREARKHDAVLTFADRKGELMADVNVAIRDAKGNTVLQTTCDGPMMVLDLPQPGKYRVHAETNGYAVNQTVTKAPGKTGQEPVALVLAWPNRVAEAAGPVETSVGGSATGGTGAAGGGGSKGSR